MGKINVLSFAVANLIAAGEVVDRPASVIKELLENSIDSGADRITVEIQNGGVLFMRVTDNGSGIERADLPTAIRRHATSKIKEAEDLDGIMTLGFRGEALAAVAAVSDLRIISRPQKESVGASIEVSGGDILGVVERGCSEGTTVIVENLFFNVPARRKFLKRDVTETAAVSAVVEKIALSHPEIAFRFIADGTEKLDTVGDGKLLSAIYAVYGRDFTKGLLEVDYDYEGIKITGYTGRSDNIKSNRSGQNFFINKRYIRSKTATAALEQAYCSYIPQDKFPVCVLNIGLNPKSVDVNVHPAKLEVKFSNEKPVFEAVYYGTKNAIESNITRPDIDPGSLSRMTYEEYKKIFMPQKPGQSPRESGGAQVRQNAIITQPAARPISENQIKNHQPPTRFEPPAPEKTEAQPVLSTQAEPASSSNSIIHQTNNEEPERLTAESYINEFRESEPQRSADNLNTSGSQINDIGVDPPADEDLEIPASPSLLPYRIIGEAFNSYIILDLLEKLLLVDKHAAHERIIFERLKAGAKSENTNSQILLLPVEFMLTSDEVLILEEYREEIHKIGFIFETERHTVRVSALPEGIELSAVGDVFMTIADRLINGTGSAELSRDMIFEKALYQASCKAAIKAGREYGPEHIKWLIDKLMEIPDITFCPHGRPVAMEISKASLDRQFKRT